MLRNKCYSISCLLNSFFHHRSCSLPMPSVSPWKPRGGQLTRCQPVITSPGQYFVLLNSTWDTISHNIRTVTRVPAHPPKVAESAWLATSTRRDAPLITVVYTWYLVVSDRRFQISVACGTVVPQQVNLSVRR